MPDINNLIREKLQGYPEDVAELALKALELSEEYPYQTVAEQLESIVRQIVRTKGEEQ